MKKISVLLLVFLLSTFAFGQEKTVPFKDGEWLRYKMSYSGFLRAGTATLEVKEEELNSKKVYHTIGKGWTTGMIKWFFKVNDTYESYFDKETTKPYLFKRDINEGGYTIKRDIEFDVDGKKAIVKDYKKNTTKEFTADNVQDMLSSFYYLRAQNTKNLKPGDEIKLNMFIDSKIFPFRLKFLKFETLETKFGKVNTMVFSPLVQSGRIFKENESVAIWITNDDNKIPIKLKAAISVGSLRAELEAYKGLANSFEIIFD
ncbi:uncharacterized protein DUF3108 [Lutibacter sp. Hel_I_33_5]|uniref:DUF3108 domain-containing protein n=1 Tax=Lutibacter sp. Hel_I_33_5 TaxID=1566289 RepID=UPI0011A8CD4B|nr:DUF3108 domain-containing protein [Lutibacter sp. Hel_I_33_5]TVZ56468.1 uncharacterized protein DUF3108 [Lutibacter sp. Hel_I_33_5]